MKRKVRGNLAVLVVACGHVDVSVLATSHRPGKNLIVLCPEEPPEVERPHDVLLEIMHSIMTPEVLPEHPIFQQQPFWMNLPRYRRRSRRRQLEKQQRSTGNHHKTTNQRGVR